MGFSMTECYIDAIRSKHQGQPNKQNYLSNVHAFFVVFLLLYSALKGQKEINVL